jgi:hypothetical protein
MRTFHIDKNRFERIKAQGYHLGTVDLAKYPNGDSEYHLINGNHAWCGYCQGEFDSLRAESPAELQMEKLSHQ